MGLIIETVKCGRCQHFPECSDKCSDIKYNTIMRCGSFTPKIMYAA